MMGFLIFKVERNFLDGYGVIFWIREVLTLPWEMKNRKRKVHRQQTVNIVYRNKSLHYLG